MLLENLRWKCWWAPSSAFWRRSTRMMHCICRGFRQQYCCYSLMKKSGWPDKDHPFISQAMGDGDVATEVYKGLRKALASAFLAVDNARLISSVSSPNGITTIADTQCQQRHNCQKYILQETSTPFHLPFGSRTRFSEDRLQRVY